MKKPSYHITQGENGWNIKRSGNPIPMGSYRNQNDAIEDGRTLAKIEKTEPRIHGRDGKIRDSDSYGNDPFPPRDRRK